VRKVHGPRAGLLPLGGLRKKKLDRGQWGVSKKEGRRGREKKDAFIKKTNEGGDALGRPLAWENEALKPLTKGASRQRGA